MSNNSEKNRSLLEIIKDKLKLGSNTKAKNIIKSGRVQVDNKTIKIPSEIVDSTQVVSIISPKKIYETSADDTNQNKGFTKIYEDDQYLAYVKPSGLLSVGTANKVKKEKNFFDLIQKQYKKENGPVADLFLINRLDRLISGIILFAKTPDFEVSLRKHWENNSKRYYALVKGSPKTTDGEIKSELKQNRIGRVYSVPKSQYSKLCVLNYRALQQTANNSLLKIEAIEERKNSIRAQLSEKNMPIVGDKDYNGGLSPVKRFGLHLFSLKFYHPYMKKEIEIKTPVPKSFNLFFKNKKKAN
jgi:23S rRNA-/tRNA-specific pseudouridylate synthase